MKLKQIDLYGSVLQFFRVIVLFLLPWLQLNDR